MTVSIPLEWFLYPIACFLVYLPALNGPPIFDDHQVIPEADRFQWTKKRFLERPYRLLTLLTFAIQKHWPGTIRSLHAGNLLIHTVNGLLVKAIGESLGMDPGLALLAGLLFVIHPFAVNAVGYITGRASILSASFGLVAVLLVLYEPSTSGLPANYQQITNKLPVDYQQITSGLQGMAVLTALFLSFLSKEDGVGFVPLVFAILIIRMAG